MSYNFLLVISFNVNMSLGIR